MSTTGAAAPIVRPLEGRVAVATLVTSSRRVRGESGWSHSASPPNDRWSAKHLRRSDDALLIARCRGLGHRNEPFDLAASKVDDTVDSHDRSIFSRAYQLGKEALRGSISSSEDRAAALVPDSSREPIARQALLVMVNLPLALVGGIAAVALTGGVLNIATLVGFITLFEIAVRNGILLVSHYNHLLDEGVPLEETVWRGSMERLSPVLMTALTAGLALVPLALAGGRPGNEV